MPRKSAKKDIPIEETVSIPLKSIPDFLQQKASESKSSLADVTIDSLKDGFYIIAETAEGKASLQFIDLFPSSKDKTKPQELIKEYRRLREKYAPIAGAIDYIKDQILGYGVDAGIESIEDDIQDEIRDWVRNMIGKVYQDIVSYGLNEILEVMVDEALTVGAAGAEIVYDKNVEFNTYVESVEQIKNAKGQQELVFKLKEPEWGKDLTVKQGIKRLKILENAMTRLKPHLHPKSWDINFWTLDESTDTPIVTGGVVIPSKTKEVNIIKYHPWEIFWLVLNKHANALFGESVIAQVYEMAILLERIEKAIGEGLYRAGNKKYFIICGTERRPWGEPHIRNFMKLMKEMQEKGWGAIPVPAGFDIKEIGGEVFEGKDITDHFMTMIAFGMGVPKDVVVSGRGRGPDISADYSNMKIVRRRNRLANTIKIQLFQRHVWGKYGKKKVKQGGKSYDETWIPPAVFTKKDFMTSKDRLEKIYNGLNVANPLFPEVTLEMNREIAEILGYEVILPDQKQFKKQKEEEEKKAEEEKLQKQKMFEERMKENNENNNNDDQKVQGKPEAQTLERQKKRLEGLGKEKKGQREQAKTLGAPRTPKEAKLEETQKVNIEETDNIDEGLTPMWDRMNESQDYRQRRVKMILDARKNEKVITHQEIDKVFAEEKLLAEKIETEKAKQELLKEGGE